MKVDLGDSVLDRGVNIVLRQPTDCVRASSGTKNPALCFPLKPYGSSTRSGVHSCTEVVAPWKLSLAPRKGNLAHSEIEAS